MHTPEGTPLPPNTLAELQRDMARLGFVVSQIRQIEDARQKRLEQQPEIGPHAMVRLLARIVGVGRRRSTSSPPRRSTPTTRRSRCWEPGLGRTRTGRLWVYSPDRGGEHPATHLAHFTGFLQADAYSGFAALYEPRKASPGFPAMPAITEVACWAHCRRSIFDVWQTTKSTVAKAALDRIAQFYAIEDKARFAPPDERLAHRTATIPLLDAFFTWAQLAERKLSARSELAQALRYIIKRRTALARFATDARLEADNNIAENAIRGIALGRRNWLFAGSHSGGQRAAAMYSILQTAKLNGINPEAYLTDIFSRIAAGHPITRISELMPWAFQSPLRDPAA